MEPHPVDLAEWCEVVHLAVFAIVAGDGLVGGHHEIIVTGDLTLVPEGGGGKVRAGRLGWEGWGESVHRGDESVSLPWGG